jgi:hypothetical protein
MFVVLVAQWSVSKWYICKGVENQGEMETRTGREDECLMPSDDEDLSIIVLKQQSSTTEFNNRVQQQSSTTEFNNRVQQQSSTTEFNNRVQQQRQGAVIDTHPTRLNKWISCTMSVWPLKVRIVCTSGMPRPSWSWVTVTTASSQSNTWHTPHCPVPVTYTLLAVKPPVGHHVLFWLLGAVSEWKKKDEGLEEGLEERGEPNKKVVINR